MQYASSLSIYYLNLKSLHKIRNFFYVILIFRIYTKSTHTHNSYPRSIQRLSSKTFNEESFQAVATVCRIWSGDEGLTYLVLQISCFPLTPGHHAHRYVNAVRWLGMKTICQNACTVQKIGLYWKFIVFLMSKQSSKDWKLCRLC